MGNISNTQYFRVNSETEVSVKEILDTVYNAMTERVQPCQSDRRVYYVRRSHLHHQPQKCQKYDYEGGEGRAGGGTSQGIHQK